MRCRKRNWPHRFACSILRLRMAKIRHSLFALVLQAIWLLQHVTEVEGLPGDPRLDIGVRLRGLSLQPLFHAILQAGSARLWCPLHFRHVPTFTSSVLL